MQILDLGESDWHIQMLKLTIPFTFIRPLGLCNQAIQLGILITFVYTFFNLIIFVNSCNVCVFYFCIFFNNLYVL